ncbi:unnamed protein product [Ceutorhynchus assimilis]|uniref:Peptidase S1 domain-containing protein n=1 Tax=Ceutorhynchus assimilis TaxID=467358 RepID=A0A9N9N0T9_9CUCU|nr:unnamed protein product [Ceutorhynchus assimilis]
MLQNYFYNLVFLLYTIPSAGPENSILERKIPETRIIHGYECSTKEYPFVVKIKLDYEGQTVTTCGGTLLRPNWVLTVANCFIFKGITTRENFWIEAGCDNSQSRQTVQAGTAHYHPKYNSFYYSHDIALVKLLHPIKSADGIGYATLPGRDDPICSKAVVMGWGLTSNSLDPYQVSPPTLQCGHVEIITKKQCSELCKNYLAFHADSQICTFSKGNEAEARMRDSGGPLLCGDVQVGIISFKPLDILRPDIAADFPFVYTNIQYFLDWINDTMKDNETSSGTMHLRTISIVFIIFFTLLHNVDQRAVTKLGLRLEIDYLLIIPTPSFNIRNIFIGKGIQNIFQNTDWSNGEGKFIHVEYGDIFRPTRILFC